MSGTTMRILAWMGVWLAFWQGLPQGPSPAEAAKVHLLVCCDNSQEAGLGADVVADKRAIVNLFQENVPQRQLNLRSIDGENLSPQRILGAINGLEVERREDSVVFYYSGHGAYDKQRGHFFSLPQRQPLLRKEVERAIVGKEPRTGVLITDCCAAIAAFKGPPVVSEPKAFPMRISPLLDYLLFERCGLIDISSSRPPQVSLTRGDGKGSLFTYPFVARLQTNMNRRISWTELLKGVADQVQADFERVTKGKGVDTDGDGKEDQFQQTVWPVMVTPALGLRAKKEGGRLTVTQVVPLSPAAHAQLKLGDELLEVNGEAVQSESAYDRAVDESPPEIRLRVRSQGVERVVKVKLNR